MYWKMFFFAVLLGLLTQLGTLCYFTQRAYRNEFTIPLAPPGRGTFEVPPAAVAKCYYPRFELFGRENRLEAPPPVRPFFRHEGWAGPRVPQSAYQAVMRKYFGGRMEAFERSLSALLRWSCLAYLLSAAYFAFFFVRSRRMTDTRFVRGSFKVPLGHLKRSLAADAAKEEAAHPNLEICGLAIPREAETRHILIMGTTGTGKSVLINQVLGQIIDRMSRFQTQERTIIYDVKGEFLSKHLRPGDLVFYPPDARSLRWSFFNEIRTFPDFDVLSQVIFKPPKETTADPFWCNSAKDVFVAGLRFLDAQGCRQNRDIWQFFSLGTEQIVAKLSTLPLEQRSCLKHIETGEGPASSVMSTLQEKISFFQYLTDSDGPFSFRDYISHPANHGHNLFLLNIKNYADTFRPLMTFAFDVMIRETLSLPDTNHREQRRIWFCIDEIGSLNQIGVLLDLLTVARSKGGCMIVANQDLGKVEDVYGRANTRTFYNNFNAGFLLRLNDPDTAEFVSKSIGEREVIKVMNSRQMSPRDTGDRKSLSDQDKTERVMLPSEFLSLRDFEAIAKVSGHGIAKTVVPRRFYEPRRAHFIDKYVLLEAQRRPEELEPVVTVAAAPPASPAGQGRDGEEIGPPRIRLRGSGL